MQLYASYDKGKMFLYFLGALCFSALGVFILSENPNVGTKGFYGGIACLIFFGGCSIVAFMRLFERRVVLSIDQSGLFDRRVADRPIPWNEIESFREMSTYRQRFFLLKLKEPHSAYTDSIAKRLLVGMNKIYCGGDVYVGAQGLSISETQLREALAYYIRQDSPT
jgi:hypothetical protein